MDPEVLANLMEAARTDPMVALKLAEHGFGRPPQALDVKVEGPQRIVVIDGGEIEGVGQDDDEADG